MTMNRFIFLAIFLAVFPENVELISKHFKDVAVITLPVDHKVDKTPDIIYYVNASTPVIEIDPEMEERVKYWRNVTETAIAQKLRDDLPSYLLKILRGFGFTDENKKEVRRILDEINRDTPMSLEDAKKALKAEKSEFDKKAIRQMREEDANEQDEQLKIANKNSVEMIRSLFLCFKGAAIYPLYDKSNKKLIDKLYAELKEYLSKSNQ